MFFAFAPSESLLLTEMTTGLLFLRVAFTAIVTGVSVIPNAIFERVLPVQGATRSKSTLLLVPIGSASTMVFIGVLPVRVIISFSKSVAL